MQYDSALNCFLSHASTDKPIVRDLGVELQLVGADVFFDAWSIDCGESIPGAIENGLDAYTVFILFWSEAAQKSAWVRREYRSAVQSFIEDEDRRFIVARTDDTPVPSLISDLKWFDLADGDVRGLVEEVMGFRGQFDRTRAIQRYLETRSIEVDYFPGYGAAVGCRRCGAGVEALKGWRAWQGDDEYGGVECTRCGWNDGGEL